MPTPGETSPAGSTETDGRHHARRWMGQKRRALFGAILIVAYGLLVALLPLVIYHDPRPPWWIERPIALFGLFGVPAVVALIGALHGARPLVVAAGVLCLLQSYIAFSGVTIGFVVPGLLLLAAGTSDSWPDASPVSLMTLSAGVIVTALTIGAWVALFAMTQPRCYGISRTADGTFQTAEVPATDQMLRGPLHIPGEGGGCSSAELTAQGLGVSTVLAIGAMAVAAAATSARRDFGYRPSGGAAP